MQRPDGAVWKRARGKARAVPAADSGIDMEWIAIRGVRRVSLALYRADGTSALIEAGLSAPSRRCSREREGPH